MIRKMGNNVRTTINNERQVITLNVPGDFWGPTRVQKPIHLLVSNDIPNASKNVVYINADGSRLT